MVIVMARVKGCFLGYKAVACPCLCQSVELSLSIFMKIGYGSCIHGVLGFRQCLRLVESVSRSWRLLKIFERVIGVVVGCSRHRNRW